MTNRVRRMVLIAPLLALSGYPVTMQTVHRFTSALYTMGLGTMVIAGGRRPRETGPFSTNPLTTRWVVGAASAGRGSPVR